jgi:hypothetical protein
LIFAILGHRSDSHQAQQHGPKCEDEVRKTSAINHGRRNGSAEITAPPQQNADFRLGCNDDWIFGGLSFDD